MWSRVGRLCSAAVRAIKKAAGIVGLCANTITVLLYFPVLTEYVTNVTHQYAWPLIGSKSLR